MKKLIIILTATTLLLSLSSCEELLDLLTVTFEGVEIEEIADVSLDGFESSAAAFKTISIISSNDTTTFQDSLILNMNAAEGTDSTEKEIADYLENISSIDIDTLSVEVLKSYEDITLPDDFEIVSLTVSFSNEEGLIHSETHENILPGELIISTVSASGLEGISTTLKNNMDLKVTFSGTVIGDNSIDYFALKTRVVADVESSLETTFYTTE